MRRKIMRMVGTMLALVLALGITGCGKTPIDYGDAESFEEALNDGEDLEGAVVRFEALELHPDSAMGYDIWAGEHLNFISSRNPKVKEGDTVVVRATRIENILGSWIIKYEIVNNAEADKNTITKKDKKTSRASEKEEETDDEQGITEDEEEDEDNEEEGIHLSSGNNEEIEERKEDESSQTTEEIDKQLDIRAKMTKDHQAVVFITNNSQTIIDELEVQINYLDASGNTIDMDSDGHDMILPGSTVVSQMDVPSSGFDDSEIEYRFSIGDHPGYKNHAEDVTVEANPGNDCVIVKITNNGDVTIDEIEYDVVLFKGDDPVTITFPNDIYDLAPGSSKTEKESTFNMETFDDYVYGKDYDRIEVYLNQAHTFR
ncbi:MAG: hypothetical protein K6F53_09620 [Lachnospiraceae bacterium]|nr:hypothetical protein [Lachnospiraceae bacterium]